MSTNFARSVAQVVVAQLAEDAGFETAQTSAMDILSDLLLRYIAEIGQSAHCYADCAQRACPNADDLLKGLSDMGVRLDDITAYIGVQEVPFAHVLPPFPLQRQPKWPPSFQRKAEAPPDNIPSWLPAFPDKHTYVSTPAYDGHDPDVKKQRQASAKAKRQAEKALVRLSKRANGPAAAITDDPGGLSSAQGGAVSDPTAGGNPFFAATTWEAASVEVAAAFDAAVQSKDSVAATEGDRDRVRHDGEIASPRESSPTLEDVFTTSAALPASQTQGSWQEANVPTAAGNSVAGGATFSKQWSAPAVAAAGSGPSRLKEALPIFREQEDAFAAAEKAESAALEAERARMGRKAAAKSRSNRAPSEAPGRAQQILDAGADAVVTCGENEGGRNAQSDDD